LSNLFDPVIKKTNEVAGAISKKIDESENPTVKTMVNYTKATGGALSTAFTGLADGGKKVGQAVGDNTRNIVEKKYGNDVSNTYLG